MSGHCCDHDTPPAHEIRNLPRYRKVLWAALLINATMLVVEVMAGAASHSQSLLADAIDFAGDAANYGVSLAVLSAGAVWRARTAMLKAWSMMGFGLLVLGRTVWALWHGQVPDPTTMGVVATLALLANVSVALMLYAFREGDANMRSVWVCSRNDAIGNVLVMVAALGVFGSGQAWPDLLVATLMAVLALQGGWQVLRQAQGELSQEAAPACHSGQSASHTGHHHH